MQLKSHEQETLFIKAQKENDQLFIAIGDPINEKGVSCEKQQEHFYLAGDWCV